MSSSDHLSRRISVLKGHIATKTTHTKGLITEDIVAHPTAALTATYQEHSRSFSTTTNLSEELGLTKWLYRDGTLELRQRIYEFLKVGEKASYDALFVFPDALVVQCMCIGISFLVSL